MTTKKELYEELEKQADTISDAAESISVSAGNICEDAAALSVAANRMAVAFGELAELEDETEPPIDPPAGEWVLGGPMPAHSLTLLNATPPADPPRPIVAVGASYNDPIYGTQIERLSNDGSFTYYSRRTPWNADESGCMYWNKKNWFIRWADGTIQNLPFTGDAEAEWHPTNPKQILYTAKNGTSGQYHFYDTDTKQSRNAFNVTAAFSGANAWWTAGEGRGSDDGRYYAVRISNGEAGKGVVCVDQTTGEIVGKLTSNRRPDHVSMSRTGKYVIYAGLQDDPHKLCAFTRDFSKRVQLHGRTTHADTALNEAGEDIYVYADYETGFIRMCNMETGAQTNLWPIYRGGGSTYACHISGTGPRGVVLVSSHHETLQNGSTLTPEMRKVFLLECKANPKAYNICHHYCEPLPGVDDYYWEPQVAFSPSGKMCAYKSNLDDGGDACGWIAHITDGEAAAEIASES